jgi:transmembrane sensor
MRNVHQFKNLRTLDQEAAVWLARLDADEQLDEKELAPLSEWIKRSPAHKNALNSLADFWSNNILTELMVPLGRQEINAGLWFGLKQKLLSPSGFTSLTATFLVVVALMFSLLSTTVPKTNGLYVTAVGQQKIITLDDGSTIQLNTNSQVAVEYENSYRNIRLLQGEAHFDVAKNPDRPFRVYAGSGRVQAIGTAFTVHLDDRDLQVLVTEGRVALASLGGPLAENELKTASDADPYVFSQSKDIATLGAGEFLTLNGEGQGILDEGEESPKIGVINDAELSRIESWRSGYLVFSGESLAHAVSEISRYTTVTITITDPNLKELQIGGRFKVGDVESMFAALEANFGIQVNQINYNQVELTTVQ